MIDRRILSEVTRHMDSFDDWDYDHLLYCVLDLLDVSDDQFLKFLEQYVSPNFRRQYYDEENDTNIDLNLQCIDVINKGLSDSGFMLAKSGNIAGRDKYTIQKVEMAETDPFVTINSYEEHEVLGEGGFGIVYRYTNVALDKDFAVKIYRPSFVTDEEKADGERRFFREAKMLFDLNHSNIVRIYDAGRFMSYDTLYILVYVEPN